MIIGYYKNKYWTTFSGNKFLIDIIQVVVAQEYFFLPNFRTSNDFPRNPVTHL